jgi:hypothetical protein
MNTNQKNKTRRVSSTEPLSSYAVNAGLEDFLNLNASEAYRRPWHRLERGLRLNRLRKFIEAEKTRMNLSAADVEDLTNILHKALDKKLLNSKTCVIYDQEKEEIQEIKGLIYHRAADGRMRSQIIEKKQGVTLRRRGRGDAAHGQQNVNVAEGNVSEGVVNGQSS